jgi:hypothetical protein
VDRVDIGWLIFCIITNFQQGGSSDGAQPQGLEVKTKKKRAPDQSLKLF